MTSSPIQIESLPKAWIEYTGFGNGTGELSFNKMVTFTALWVFVGTVAGSLFYLQMIPPASVWAFGFGVLGAGFGLKGYLGAAGSRQDISNQADSLNVSGSIESIIDAIKRPAPAREVDLGIQPSGHVPAPYNDGE